MTSILNTVKKALGLTDEYEFFDIDIILYINTSFAVLTQLGAGPTKGFSITSDAEEWEEFMEPGPTLELVKAFVCKRVQMLFDPPQNGAFTEANKNAIDELTFRISVAVDSDKTFAEEGGDD